MGAGIVCFQRPGPNLVVRVGREEEGVSSLRPELAAIARTIQGFRLHMMKACASLGCELCKRERTMNRETTDVLPTETLAYIQSAGCKSLKKNVIGAHNRCWKYLIGSISTHGESTRDLEFIGGDKDKQLEKLWTETKIGDILPWDEIADEAEWLLERDQATRRVLDDDRTDKKQEGYQEVDQDGTDTHMETIFGRRRPDSITVEWSSKVIYILEFKRTSDQRQGYRSAGKPGHGLGHGLNTKSLSKASKRWERVLFIGTQFSNLYTAVDTPAKWHVR
jgi:hypothetical protein